MNSVFAERIEVRGFRKVDLFLFRGISDGLLSNGFLRTASSIASDASSGVSSLRLNSIQ